MRACGHSFSFAGENLEALVMYGDHEEAARVPLKYH